MPVLWYRKMRARVEKLGILIWNQLYILYYFALHSYRMYPLYYLAFHIDVIIIGIIWFLVDQDNLLEGMGTTIGPLL